MIFLLGLAVWFFVASLVTAFLYVRDKRAAGTSRQRIPERTLLAWSLLGGWPGGMIAGRKIRHKTQKLSFRLWFAGSVVLNLVATVAMIWMFRSWIFA